MEENPAGNTWSLIISEVLEKRKLLNTARSRIPGKASEGIPEEALGEISGNAPRGIPEESLGEPREKSGKSYWKISLTNL